MVIDCFPFRNELDLLSIRSDILDSYVDTFLVFDLENQEVDLGNFKEKITHIKTEKFDSDGIINTLLNLDLGEDDVIILSEINQIPNLSQMNTISDCILTNTAIRFENFSFLNSFDMKCYDVALNNQERDRVLKGSTAFFYKLLKAIKPEQLWSKADEIYTYKGAKGWTFEKDNSLKAKKIDPEDYFPPDIIENKDKYKNLFST